MDIQRKHQRWFAKLKILVEELLSEYYDDVDEDIIIDITDELHDFIMKYPMPPMMEYA
jgi:hypothetical protein